MNTLTGLFDHMVLQRNARHVSEASFGGLCTSQGDLRVSVWRGGKLVRGFKDAPAGKARGGKFKGLLRGLPSGGPYRLQISIVDRSGKALEKLVFKDVLVGDVWVAAGQSNMNGRGITTTGCRPHPLVRAFYMDDHWGVAKDPLYSIEIAVDEFHNAGERQPTARKDPRAAGPAIGFAREMHRMTGVPQGIIASAHGGTSMTQWDPELKGLGGKSLYGANLRRCIKNGGRVSGVIWYQGESDANVDDVKHYTDRMKKLIAAFRRDLKDSALPVVVVQIGRVVGTGFAAEPWNSIQEQQRRLPKAIRKIGVVPAIDMDLDDLVHIGGSAQPRLGSRLAYAMNALVRGPRGGKPPITLRRISVQPADSHITQDVLLEFDNIEGRLRSLGRPLGFTVCDPSGTQTIYRTDLLGNKIILRTSIPDGDFDGKSLYYGLGTDPVCNITDARDRGLLVMGPIPVSESRALTPFVQSFRVGGPLPGRGKLRDLAYPADLGSVGWRTLSFPTNFADVHPEIEKLKPADNVYYFQCRVHCSQDMELALVLGYDGPVKVWVDGVEKYADPNGTNPASPQQGRARFTAAAGVHDVLVALGTNNSKAWGIYLRCQRLDVSRKTIAMGPTAYVMPTISSE